MTWQPIESAPDDGTVILLWAFTEDAWENDEGERSTYAAYYENGAWWLDGASQQLFAPTHWMERPVAPVDQP